MAITGSGTEADPYLVHSYDELKSTINGIQQYAYIDLVNDIDCNDYGESFEWSTVSVSGSTRRFFLDLKTHTIKNMKLASDSSMFATGRDAGNSLIKNGKILNLFITNGSKGFCTHATDTGRITGLTLDNVSMSVNLSGAINFGAAIACEIKNSAIYVEGDNFTCNSNTPCLFFSYDTSGYHQSIENSDFYFNIENSKTNVFCGDQFAEKHIKNCRFRGKCNFSSSESTNKYMMFNGRACMEDCAIDVESTNMRLESYGYSTGTVANKDILPTSAFESSAIIQVGSDEIISGSALRSAGFNVVNVVA